MKGWKWQVEKYSRPLFWKAVLSMDGSAPHLYNTTTQGRLTLDLEISCRWRSDFPQFARTHRWRGFHSRERDCMAISESFIVVLTNERQRGVGEQEVCDRGIWSCRTKSKREWTEGTWTKERRNWRPVTEFWSEDQTLSWKRVYVYLRRLTETCLPNSRTEETTSRRTGRRVWECLSPGLNPLVKPVMNCRDGRGRWGSTSVIYRRSSSVRRSQEDT